MNWMDFSQGSSLSIHLSTEVVMERRKLPGMLGLFLNCRETGQVVADRHFWTPTVCQFLVGKVLFRRFPDCP